MKFIFTFNCIQLHEWGFSEGRGWFVGEGKNLSFRNANKTKVGFIQFVGILGPNKRGVVAIIGNDFIGFL